MILEINALTTPFVFKYLLIATLSEAATCFVLIDTGRTNKRGAIEEEIESVGSQPGNLTLIVPTHDGVDHCGSAMYLQKE